MNLEAENVGIWAVGGMVGESAGERVFNECGEASIGVIEECFCGECEGTGELLGGNQLRMSFWAVLQCNLACANDACTNRSHELRL